jgi:hypothetical protein
MQMGGLGDLQPSALAERGENGINPPLGYAPPANVGIPTQPGGAPSNQTLPFDQSNWQSIPFIVGTSVILLQPNLARKFLLLQNLSGTGSLFFGFGWTPSATNSLALPVGFGYEPFRYPTNEIYVVSDMGGTAGIIIYGS